MQKVLLHSICGNIAVIPINTLQYMDKLASLGISFQQISEHVSDRT